MPNLLPGEKRDLVFRLNASLLAGATLSMARSAPGFLLDARTGAAAATIAPRFVLTSSLKAGVVASANLRVPRFTLSATIRDEMFSRANLVVPGFRSIYGIAEGVVPPFRIFADMRADTGAVVRLLAVNTRNGAPTEYDGFDVEWFGRVGDEYVAANATGVILLDGDTDAGDPIDWAFALPPRDFKTRKLKTLPYIYVEAATDGPMLVTATADETTVVRALTHMAGRNRRAKLARGVKGVLWAVRFESHAGVAAAIDSVELVPMILGRKV